MQYQSLSPNIGVANVNETVTFYTETLGFKLVLSTPNSGELEWAMLKNGDAVIMFQEMQSLKKEYPQLTDYQSPGALTFYVKMKNMKDLYSKLKDTSFLALEMHKTFYGADEFAIFDNNGYILTITEDSTEPLTIKNYDNFFLPAENYKESSRFFAETLELEKKFEFSEQGMVAFSIGKEEAAIILKDKTKFPDSAPTIWMEVEDVHTIYDKLKTSIVFLSEPFRIRTGWAVEFTDPSGNRLGFTDYKN
ncbi:MAG: VOC family protein [Tannerella sp.]|jgi:predicted enzyme related to lactoylglutathione lyase|nr:VOC family protein [Tannerella sp.]